MSLLYVPYTPFTLQAVSPAVGHVWRPSKSVSNCPLPCESYGSFKLFKISASDFSTMSIRRQFRLCTYEFLATVTESVVHSVYKVVIWWSFGVIRRHKVS